VKTSIRKKSYEKCCRIFIIWFPTVSVPSKTSMTEFKDVISNTFSDMQLNYIIHIICGNVRPLRLPHVWVELSIECPV
jgi:hypothetical protein